MNQWFIPVCAAILLVATCTINFVLITIAFACLPLFGLWCLGGYIADQAGQRRVRRAA